MLRPSMDRLLDSYDVIVVGTGITEAMLSSALGRARSSVLHLDANGYYGDVWATKSLTEFVLWLSRPAPEEPQQPAPVTTASDRTGAVSTVRLPTADASVANRDWFWAPRLQEEMEVNRENLLQREQARPDIRGDRPSRVSLQQLVNQNRRFNLDISPRLTFARSGLMNLLHRTGLGFYSDIQRVGRCLHMRQSGRLISLPVEPAGIESWPRLSESERISLASFLQQCRSWPASLPDQQLPLFPGAAADERQLPKTLDELLELSGVTSPLAKSLVIESYAMCQPDEDAFEGVRRIQRYLSSLPDESESRLGPLAWVHYGSNEIAEVFCRHSAVWGATFVLRRGVESVNIEDGRVTGVTLSGGARERVSARQLVLNARYAPAHWLEAHKVRHVARAVFVTDAPLRAEIVEPTDAEANRGACVTHFVHRIDGYRNLARVIELPTTTKACPPDTWVVHITLPLSPGDASSSPRQAFLGLTSALFATDEDDTSRPHALLSAFFTVKDYSESIRHRQPGLPDNVHLVSGADSDVDFDGSVRCADEAFRRMCPGRQFLPSTPPHSMSESPVSVNAGTV
ncbi:hypothetical protein BOX15_Mlig008200g2 [Macrostomum lignano]|uniref:Rab proteins geranylgeranyltransferase component A n=2 Tax=Macrostomum lignano TaxID=282301 RepID=A0A1I8IM22_9PLAT|nr:hypothetical protein BOX15_Mlig008200g2 [Macrostomum lignano]